MRLIDETLEELIEEEEEILTSVSESDLKRLYNSKPELKDLFDSVLSGQAGLSHKYTVMELIKSLNNEELTLTPEKPFLQCNDNLTDNVNEIKSLSFNYYLLQYVFKQLLKNGECTIGYIDNAIESVSKSSKQEFKNLIRACKDVSIKEFFNNLELKIRGSYESPLKGKLINKVIQLRKAVKPFINELFESTNKVPISEYYKMSYVTDLIVKGLNHIPTGVIPWNNSYIKANKSLRLLQDCIPSKVLKSLIKKVCFKYEGDLNSLITELTSDVILPKGVKGVFITGYLRHIYKPIVIHELKNTIKQDSDYDKCLSDLLNRNIDLYISDGLKDLGLEVEKTKEDFIYKYYSKAMFFSKKVDKLYLLMPTEEHEGIDLFKKEVSDGNYMMMPNDIFDRIRLEDNFNRVFEACAEFPLVSKEDYDNCSLIRQYMNPEKFNELAKKTGNEFSSSLEKVTEFYDNNELVKAVNAYFFR